MQLATFKVTEVKEANEFMAREDIDVKSSEANAEIIVVYYVPVLSLEDYRRKEILRTIRQIEENRIVAAINTATFKAERKHETGTKATKKDELIAISEGQEAQFTQKITDLTLLLNEKVSN